LTDFHEIYRSGADSYDALVAREDYAWNLLPALQEVCQIKGAMVAELGAGTGRVTRLMAPLVKALYAFDQAPAMLAVATAHKHEEAWGNVGLALAENDRLPLADQAVQTTVAGWSIGHTVGWHPDDWPKRVLATVAEMQRVTKPGGTVVIIETLGTGHNTPNPPPVLVPYYQWLAAQGFEQTWLRTDYQFETLLEGDILTRFFFGDALADQLLRSNSTILPECTGIWWRQV
jgi:ubiquinone/menaquinone biosynthesis C-methylase UbiE